ncbi:uncharacterized protein PGRI_095340 [Penicillium griseofulvum]|uniref:Heat shock protein 70 family n=1 Tax=Penicillium patulum TaxID=5078 RepID=A0A135LQN5_PENPA|nr:uncharacterized protein PGRI_095340 [Penicillium griseofulvum]KXG51273.1 hypothetical protein PGRI_095340 [Penicillium griseofulvum]
MLGNSRLSTALAHRKRVFQEISDANEAPVTPSVSDSDSIGIRPATPTRKPNRRKNGHDNMAYIVGLDFGTTMTSVSYCRFNSDKRPAKVPREKIKDITDWPSAGRDQQRGEVPSESLYLDDKFYWGYQARQKLEQFHYSGGVSDKTGRLIRFTKLLLAEPESKEEDGAGCQLREVRDTLSHLGKTVLDAVEDYLVEVFRFAKDFLKDQVNFTESSEVELSLSVPAGWPIEASWSLQHIVREAATVVNFGQVSSLFIINEPEAASAFALDIVGGTNVSDKERGDIHGMRCWGRHSSKFIEEDCYDVQHAYEAKKDVTTYTVEQKSPFRLMEAVPPSEHQLSYNLFRKFENELKRNFDSGEGLVGSAYLDLHGLEENPSKGFGKGMITVKRERVMEWFRPSLEGITDLIKQQLDACANIDVRVQKIILFGGYSQSKTLQNFLKQRFSHPKIVCPKPGAFETTVSRGTVYRAVDKSKGPLRKAIANIGILQSEPYNPKKFPSHNQTTGDRNSHNKRLYVYGTAQWIIKKGNLMDWNESVRERNHRVIPVGQPWVIKQSIYYNALIEDPQDHYPVDHPKNAGSRWVDTVVFDITKAKEQYPLKAKGPRHGKHYEIYYDLLVELQGRNLKVSVVYPPGGEVQGCKEISVAACFRPGTE